MRSTAVTPPPRSRTSVTVLLAALAGGVASFAFGRLTAEPPATPAAPARAARVPSSAPAPPAFPRLPVPAAPAPAVSLAPAAAVPAPPPPAQSSTVIARATEETRSHLEALRRELVARCWPEGGLGRGREQARLTFRVTFDASGREIARAISEDRGAPAGAFGRCLRSLPAGSLWIEPPGRTVGVTVPFTFP